MQVCSHQNKCNAELRAQSLGCPTSAAISWMHWIRNERSVGPFWNIVLAAIRLYRGKQLQMVSRRVETTPNAQLEALRAAHKRYSALAEKIRKSTDLGIDPETQHDREQYARRIAQAYANSINNSLAQMSDNEEPRSFAWVPTLQTWLIIGGTASAIGAALIIAQLRTETLPPQPVVSQRAEVVRNRIPPVTNASRKADFGTADLNPSSGQAPRTAVQPSPSPSPRKPFASEITTQPQNSFARPSPSAPHGMTARNQLTAQLIAVPKPQARPRTSLASAIRRPNRPVIANTVWPAKEIAHQIPPVERERELAPLAKIVPPPAPAMPQVTKLEPIEGTHTPPDYPPFAARTGQAGTTRMKLAVSPEGWVTDCDVVASSGSEMLDRVACTHILESWRWKAPTQDGRPFSTTTSATIVWNLTDAH